MAQACFHSHVPWLRRAEPSEAAHKPSQRANAASTRVTHFASGIVCFSTTRFPVLDRTTVPFQRHHAPLAVAATLFWLLAVLLQLFGPRDRSRHLPLQIRVDSTCVWVYQGSAPCVRLSHGLFLALLFQASLLSKGGRAQTGRWLPALQSQRGPDLRSPATFLMRPVSCRGSLSIRAVHCPLAWQRFLLPLPTTRSSHAPLPLSPEQEVSHLRLLLQRERKLAQRLRGELRETLAASDRVAELSEQALGAMHTKLMESQVEAAQAARKSKALLLRHRATLRRRHRSEQQSKCDAARVQKLKDRTAKLEVATKLIRPAKTEQVAELQSSLAADISEVQVKLTSAEAQRRADQEAIESLQGALESTRKAWAAEKSALSEQLVAERSASKDRVASLQQRWTSSAARVQQLEAQVEAAAELQEKKVVKRILAKVHPDKCSDPDAAACTRLLVSHLNISPEELEEPFAPEPSEDDAFFYRTLAEGYRALGLTPPDRPAPRSPFWGSQQVLSLGPTATPCQGVF